MAGFQPPPHHHHPHCRGSTCAPRCSKSLKHTELGVKSLLAGLDSHTRRLNTGGHCSRRRAICTATRDYLRLCHLRGRGAAIHHFLVPLLVANFLLVFNFSRGFTMSRERSLPLRSEERLSKSKRPFPRCPDKSNHVLFLTPVPASRPLTSPPTPPRPFVNGGAFINHGRTTERRSEGGRCVQSSSHMNEGREEVGEQLKWTIKG